MLRGPSAVPGGPIPSTAHLARLYVAVFAAVLIVVLGALMASQLPGGGSVPAAAPVAVYAPAVRASRQPAPVSAMPTSPADLNGGNRGFPAESLTVNQGLP